MRQDRFERLYSEHAERLFAFFAYRTGDRALAEDLLGDVFERVLRARRPFDARRGSEQTWLYAIALNRLRDHVRHADAERRALDRLDEAPEEVTAAGETLGERDELHRALAALSATERETIALRFGADLTAPQIAQVAGQPLTTIEGRLYRALRKLRDDLAPDAQR